MKRVGIVGSREYTNRRKIKEFVFKLKEQFGDKVEIVSGGQKLGADGLAKKFALECTSNKPQANKVYALTGGPGSKCIANGNSWAESEVKENK